MNWIRRAWRALVRASEPEAPRRVNVSDHPGAMLEAFDGSAQLEDETIDSMAERLEHRTMVCHAAAMIANATRPQGSATRPVTVLGAGHRAYILAHFGLDVAKPETREELGRELGMRVELAAPA